MFTTSTILFISTHAPAGGATWQDRSCPNHQENFYSRPCGRGDTLPPRGGLTMQISTHAPAGGATGSSGSTSASGAVFLLTPLREGRLEALRDKVAERIFLLTPLREGRPRYNAADPGTGRDFYSRPCGRGDFEALRDKVAERIFLLTPLREGRQQFSTSPS